jgi:hypothetical protein
MTAFNPEAARRFGSHRFDRRLSNGRSPALTCRYSADRQVRRIAPIRPLPEARTNGSVGW